MEKVIAIVGPTAAGKTAVSIALAKAVTGEVVSADSRQVYCGLDIGTGKITPEEMDGVPHHLLDVADPNETFTAARYVDLARAAIADIAARSHVPIVVGGTGLYVDALLGRVSLANVEPNPELRQQLADNSLQELREKLQRLDPERYATIDTKNRRRLERAIEISSSEVPPEPYTPNTEHYSVLWLGIALPREELNEKIHTRLIARMDAGMLEEAKQLYTNGLSYERMEELGLEYRYLARYLGGKLTYDEMLRELEQEIRKYAKRQMTWFKRNKDIRWFAPDAFTELTGAAQAFLEN